MNEKLVFVVDDEANMRKLMSYWIESEGYRVAAFESATQCLDRLHERPWAICLDIMMPKMDGLALLKRIQAEDSDLPVIMVTAKDSIDSAVQAMRLGAYDYVTKPIDRHRLSLSLGKAMEKYAMAQEIRTLRHDLSASFNFDHIIGKSPVMQQVFQQVRKVLESNISVFIHGESGTGKELIARAIHYYSNRKNGPFEVVNCGAVPENLQESEFFGHEKGAFTGATQSQIGKVERANHGTLFLDEVGEMTPALQVKLLRFLQDKSFDRVGGRRRIEVDVRIVSATNKNLEEELEKGGFREDLYYRLVVFPIQIPPLRERKEDIPALAVHFLKKYEGEAPCTVRSIDPQAMKALVRYDWPGNVRELENTIYRALLSCDNGKLNRCCLPGEIALLDGAAAVRGDLGKTVNGAQHMMSIEEMEKLAMIQAIDHCNGNYTAAARQIGMSRATFYRKAKKYALKN